MVAIAIAFGGTSFDFLKQAAEIMDRVVAASIGDFRDAFIGAQQRFLRFL